MLDFPEVSEREIMSMRRIPSDQLDYYIYVDFLTPKLIDLLTKVELEHQHLSIMYVFKEAQISRQEYFEEYGKDIPLAIHKLPNGFDWKDLSIGDKSKITFINVCENNCEGSDKGKIHENFFKSLVNDA
jgi:hypothetical protein